MKFFHLILICAFCLAPATLGCQDRRLYKDNRVMMGTFVEVTSPDERASGIAFAEVARIEALLSKYDPDSEISRLNKSGLLKVSPETIYILQKAKEIWLASGGAFDVTVGPLMDLWGFTDKKYACPQEGQIKKALSYIGMDKISFNNKNNVVKFKIRGIKIDLGAIAKGYALDCAVNKLKEANVGSCLINAGGQIHALGDKFGRPWKIAIKNPRANGMLDFLELSDKAVSTSGDYEQYFLKGDTRYSHIFNPKTGYPADSGVISATVIAPDGLTADALCTSIFVMGKERGAEFASGFEKVEIRIKEENDKKI